MTTLCDQICASLRDEPTQWRQGEHMLRHKNGVEIWICSGVWYVQQHKPERRCFSIVEKWRIWRAYKAWQRLPMRLETAK